MREKLVGGGRSRALARVSCGASVSLTEPALPCCNGCGEPRYCDEKCQRNHWDREHKYLCFARNIELQGRKPTDEEDRKTTRILMAHLGVDKEEETLSQRLGRVERGESRDKVAGLLYELCRRSNLISEREVL